MENGTIQANPKPFSLEENGLPSLLEGYYGDNRPSQCSIEAFDAFPKDLNDTLAPFVQDGYAVISNGKESTSAWILMTNNTSTEPSSLHMSKWSPDFTALQNEFEVKVDNQCWNQMATPLKKATPFRTNTIMNLPSISALMKDNYGIAGFRENSKKAPITYTSTESSHEPQRIGQHYGWSPVAAKKPLAYSSWQRSAQRMPTPTVIESIDILLLKPSSKPALSIHPRRSSAYGRYGFP